MKTVLYKTGCFSVLATLLFCAPLKMGAQEVGAVAPKSCCTKHKLAPAECHSATIKGWYLGGGFVSPQIFADLASWNKNNFSFGVGGAVKLGYTFNPLFSLEGSFTYGHNSLTSAPYQKGYVLGLKDAYTYYPYMQIDGTTYSNPSVDLFGELGNNTYAPNGKAELPGVSFSKIVSHVHYIQSSLNTVFNFTRLFTPVAAYRTMPVEWLVAPGIYLSKFNSKIGLKEDATNLATGKEVKKSSRIAPSVNNRITWGMGGYTTVRFNLTPRVALDLTNSIVWQHDRVIDGVRSGKRAYDAFLWAPELGIVVKLGKRNTCQQKPVAPQPVPQKVAKSPAQPTIPELLYEMPNLPIRPIAKKGKHTAEISLNYVVNGISINPKLANNEAKLEALRKDLDHYANNSDYIIKTLLIEGFASPEGNYNANIRLAEGRANSLITYIKQNSRIAASQISLGRTTENWEGLRKLLEERPEITNREGLLKVFVANTNTEARKAELKKTAGYAELVRDYYPTLRTSRYCVEYEIPPYTPEQALEKFEKDPKLLSASELYSVVRRYGLNSAKANTAVATMQALFPHSKELAICQGTMAIKNKEYAKAITLLRGVANTNTTLQNLLGVAYAYSNQPQKAIALFNKVSANDKQAMENYQRMVAAQQKK